ncbi:MAG: helix-turn-helix domain-containing protein, partial [Candidatus Sumerlaeota bacterium]
VQYWANRVKNAIDTTLFTGIAVRDALDNLRFSYRQLSRIFKSVYGLSPKAYQVEARLGIAEELLTSSTQPISGIASELNYPSSQHFAAQFKKARGLTPSQYRERHSFSIDNGSSPEGMSG